MSGGRVGVAGRQRPVVAGGHRLEHVQRLARPTLTDDDPVGTHVHGVAQQVADGDLAAPLEVGRTRLEREHVRLPELQLGRILDGDDPLVVGDERRQHVEAGRLARTRPARDEHVEPRLDAGAQEVEHLGRRRPEPDHVVDGDRLGRELADRDHGTDERQRLDDRVDARAVGQSGVDPRARLVDAATERGDDPVDDPEHVLVVEEDGVDAQDLAAALDVQVVRAVDHDLGHGLVGEQRLERAESAHLADELLHEPHPLGTRHRKAVGGDDPVDDALDLGPELLRLGVEQRGEDELDLVLHLLADLPEQLVAGRDALGRRRGRGRRRHWFRRGRRWVGDGLLGPLDPLEQRHEVQPPLGQRVRCL